MGQIDPWEFPCIVMNTELIFNIANLFVLPFWALMIVLPNWGVTKKVMDSLLPFALLASVYLYLFVTAITPESAEALASPKLADIARAFADQNVMATGWVHYLVMDLFVGRWIYQQGQKTAVWTIHSLILCLFAGPLGLLSHILTTVIRDRFFTKNQTEIATES
jgi:hypothetical protein